MDEKKDQKKTEAKPETHEKSNAEKDKAPMNILPYLFDEKNGNMSVSLAEQKAMKEEVTLSVFSEP